MVAAKSVKSCKWFVRIDGTESFLRQKCGELSRCLDTVSMLAAYHVGDTKENPHTHFVIEVKAETQKQSFAVRLKSLFEITKKSQYALDVWDGDLTKGAVSYLFHEGEEDTPTVLLVNKGWDISQLETAQRNCEAVKKVVAMNKEKASQKLVDRALLEFAKEKNVTRYDILHFMLKQCKAGDAYYPGTFMLKKFVEEVELRLCHDSNFDSYVSGIMSEIWRS